MNHIPPAMLRPSVEPGPGEGRPRSRNHVSTTARCLEPSRPKGTRQSATTQVEYNTRSSPEGTGHTSSAQEAPVAERHLKDTYNTRALQKTPAWGRSLVTTRKTSMLPRAVHHRRLALQPLPWNSWRQARSDSIAARLGDIPTRAAKPVVENRSPRGTQNRRPQDQEQ